MPVAAAAPSNYQCQWLTHCPNTVEEVELSLKYSCLRLQGPHHNPKLFDGILPIVSSQGCAANTLSLSVSSWAVSSD